MICLFTDASFDPKSKKGVAGYLRIEADQITELNTFAPKIHTTQLEETSSGRLELRAVIWALESVAPGTQLALYTDYETVVKLVDRRQTLEQRGYKSRRTGVVLTNADLYLRFFELFDRLAPDLYWLKGHKPKSERTAKDLLLSLVDRETRSELRKLT